MKAQPSRADRVYLTGFMGSGKTTIGPILANTLGYDFVDIDRTIETEAGAAVTEIFRTRGQDEFRRIERELILRLSTRPKTVISLGGGTLTDPDSFRCVTTTGILVYLKVPPEHLLNRLRHKTDRPLLVDASGERLGETELLERVKELQQAREPYYAKADITILADDRKIGLTVDAIVRKLAPMLR